jgi:DNA helicase-2/ATP-dependent DNA helicase PcrA
MINLSSPQHAVVFAGFDQPMLVLASAGSGKTRVLTERVRYILENTKKEGVVALTFTNKAAEEILARLDDMAEERDRCWIGTIHSIAQRVVEQYGHTIGLPHELHIYERDEDRKTMFLQSLRDTGVDIDVFLNVSDDKTKKERGQIIQNYLDQFAYIKRELLTEDEVKVRYANDDRFWKTYKEYQNSLIMSGGLDFDDILVYAHRILLEQPWCAKLYRVKYKHVCVDEAQDLNKAQYEFIKAFCGEEIKSLMMVGDPNQMIYGFNGASSDFLCNKYVSDYHPVRFEINDNYRSSRSVIRLANKLIPGSQVENDFALTGLCEIRSMPDETAEALWIASKIKTLLLKKADPEIEGEITLANMVVIGRNRFVFREIERIFEVENISFSLKKGERKVEPSSLFGKVLDLSVRLLINPKDWVGGKKLCVALNLPVPENWGEVDILKTFALKISSASVIFSDIQKELLMAVADINVNNPNVPKLFDHFNNKLATLKNNIPEDKVNELERSLLELQEFRNCWTAFRRKGLGESLSAFRNAIALGQLTNEQVGAGLTLSTVHTMKGLEKDIVFLVGMCEGVFPDYRAKSKKDIDEELNSAFVAITRAKRWIYITNPMQRVMPWGGVKSQQVSRFVSLLKS